MLQDLATFILLAIAFGALIYGVLGQRIEALDPKKARLLRIAPDGSEQAKEAARQEERVQKKNTDTRTATERLIEQAGVDWTTAKFTRIRVIAAVVSLLTVYIVTQNYMFAIVATTISLATVPGGYLNYARAKRYKAFLKEFPTAIDIMVRSVQAGLTLNEGLHTIITEVDPPISDEFQRVVDRMTLGESLGSAITVLQERLPLQEVHFFVSTVGIQQQTGGSLAGTLENLSAVIRDRKDMQERIKALSGEARISALILAALAPVVLVGFAIVNPSYLAPLISTTLGNMTLGGAALWMAFGFIIMRRMVNFKV